MTIGVRGTAFDLAVRAGSGKSMVIVHEGATSVCDILNRCMEANRGTMAASSQEGVRAVPPGRDRQQRLNAFFPLIKSQSGLGSPFVVSIPGAFQGGGNGEPRHDGTGENPAGEVDPPPTPTAPPDPDGRP